MPSINLTNLSNPENLTNANDMYPLSFLDWRSRNTGISFSEAEIQYRNYINSFYKKTESDNAVAANKIKNDYLNLIQKLQVIFKDDEEFTRYTSIDLNSDTDLTLVIPAYAKKLKEIALFYSKKRQELKNKKIEYNLVGSFDGLNKLLYTNLVSKFTKNEQTQFVSENPLITQAPEFSSISDSFSIEIEELYDTTDYFDTDSNSINPFACIFNDLCYSLFSTALSAKADPLENNYLCNPSNETVDQLLQKAYAKYLSTDICFVSGGYYTEFYKDLEIPLDQGNNFFYWFSGKTVFDIPEGIYKDVNIHQLDWTNATGGSSIDIADLVFTTVGSNVQGAWLQDTDKVVVRDSMSATITDGKVFKFPYPNYGVSSVGGAWSGPSLDDTLYINKKFFPTEEDYTQTENNINKLYWSSFSSISTANSVYLQETNLGKHGFASNRFNNADKIYVSEQSDLKQLYNGNVQIAWLYDFRQTQLPIKAGDNKIYFPIQRYDNDSELFFNFQKGQSVVLSSLYVPDSFAGSVASETLDKADMIIKNQTICGPEIEAAWLKAVPLKYYSNYDKRKCSCSLDQVVYYTDWTYLSGGAQASLAFKCDAGKYIRFVWTGETIDINQVEGFNGFEHDDSCPYKHEDLSVSIVDKNIINSQNESLFEKWKKCNCGAIQHSPFSHSQSRLEHFNLTPDFIVKDVSYPKQFNKKTWIGSDSNNYETSKDSARFIPNLIETDIGWGKGTWKTQTDESFILEKGKSYIYYRANISNCNFESPYFVINQKYPNGNVLDDDCNNISFIPRWFKAVQNENNEWVDANVESDMIINFGDFLNYKHQSSTLDTRSRFLYSGNEVTSTSGEYVVFSSGNEYISYKENSEETPSINFLMKIPISSYNNFWGHASYNDSNLTNKYFVQNDEFRVVYDYVRMTQPVASDILLSDKNIIEYKFGDCNNTCFIWEENLTFEVYAPVKKWNKIIFDSCSKTNVLQYFTSEISNCYNREIKCVSDCDSQRNCGCEFFCNPTITSLTASFIDSDINFNTEMSGIPMFVNYFAQKAFVQDVRIQDVTNGEKSLFVPVVCQDLITLDHPWRNLLNQNGSNFVVEENVENLRNAADLNFYSTKRIGMNRFETLDSNTTFYSENTSVSVYRKDNYFDAPFQKLENNSEYITDFSLGKKQGDINCYKKQTFIPYTNNSEKTNKSYYGLYEVPLEFSPWKNITGEWKESDLYINYRNQYNITCDNNWFDDQLVLTNNVRNWQTDVFGNHYFVTHNEDLTSTVPPSSFATIFVKLANGKVETMENALSAITNLYNNFEITLFDSFSGI